MVVQSPGLVQFSYPGCDLSQTLVKIILAESRMLSLHRELFEEDKGQQVHVSPWFHLDVRNNFFTMRTIIPWNSQGCGGVLITGGFQDAVAQDVR